MGVRPKQLSLLDKVLSGLSGSMLAQLVIISYANISGHVDIIRHFYLTYPVLSLFTSLGLLSLSRIVLKGRRLCGTDSSEIRFRSWAQDCSILVFRGRLINQNHQFDC